MDFTYLIAWQSHFPRPDACPTVLCRGTKEECEKVYIETKLDPSLHYAFTPYIPSKPKRYMSQEAVAKMRVNKLHQRLKKEIGELFYEYALEEELARNPRYYKAEDVPERTAMMQKLDAEAEAPHKNGGSFTPAQALDWLHKTHVVSFINAELDALDNFRRFGWEEWMEKVIPYFEPSFVREWNRRIAPFAFSAEEEKILA